PHQAFFTFGENYGRPDCKLPVAERFRFQPTRQPVMLDFWNHEGDDPGRIFTTIGNWKQPHRVVEFQGEVYHWSKHYEFLKFLDLPRRTNQAFELALSSYDANDQQMLEENHWHVGPAANLSSDIDA